MAVSMASSDWTAGLLQMTHEGAADDDAVGDFAQRADVFRPADAEADAQRHLGLLTQPGKLIEQFRRHALAFAGDAGDADAVEEAGRTAGDGAGAFARRGRRDEVNQFEVAGGGQAG